MERINLSHGTVFVLNPLCFPRLAGNGREEIPNFFDVIRFAWIEGDRETLKKAVEDLRERARKKKEDVDYMDLEELVEIEALSALLEAGISNMMVDWGRAYGPVSGLAEMLKNICEHKSECKCECERRECIYTKKAIEATEKIKSFCSRSATF